MNDDVLDRLVDSGVNGNPARNETETITASVAWSLYVCLSHSRTLLKPFDGFRCHLGQIHLINLYNLYKLLVTGSIY